MNNTNSQAVRRRRRQIRRNKQLHHRSGVILLLLFFAALLLLTDVAVSAVRRLEKTADATKIISAEVKKAIKKGGDKDTLQLLSKILIQQLGKPYEYGAAGPNAFDCSGLVQYVYAQLDIELPRVVSRQARVGSDVPDGKLKFGDIVFFPTTASP